MTGYKTYLLCGVMLLWLGFGPKLGIDDQTVWTVTASLAAAAGITLRQGVKSSAPG